jgi:hypothetical protein
MRLPVAIWIAFKNGQCDKGHSLFPDAGNPSIGLYVIDVDLTWELIHADGGVTIQISLLCDPVPE